MKSDVAWRVLRGAGANATTQIVIAAFQLALVPIMASHWGLELYGWWILVSTIPAYVALTDFGLATAASALMTMHIVRSEFKPALAILQNAWLAIVFVATTVLVTALIIIWSAPTSFMAAPHTLTAQDSRLTISLLIAQATIALQGNIFLAGFRSTRLYAFGEYTQAMLFSAEGLVTAFFVLSGRSPLYVAGGLLICRTVGVLSQAAILKLKNPWMSLSLHEASWARIKDLVKPSAGVFALTAAQITFLQGTTFAVGAASSASAAAIFSSIRTLTRVGIQLAGLVTRALGPEYSIISAHSDSIAQARMIAASLAISSAILIPISIVLFVAGNQIVILWTHGIIHPEPKFLYCMIIVTIVHGLWLPISSLLTASNQHIGFAYKYLLLSVASIGLSFVLAQRFDELGGALSLLILDTITAAIVFRTVATLVASPTVLFKLFLSDARKIYKTFASLLKR